MSGRQDNKSLRAPLSGSSIMLHLLSNTIVDSRAGSNASHFNPRWLGSPVRAKFAQAVAMVRASFCASVNVLSLVLLSALSVQPVARAVAGVFFGNGFSERKGSTHGSNRQRAWKSQRLHAVSWPLR